MNVLDQKEDKKYVGKLKFSNSEVLPGFSSIFININFFR